MTDVGDLSLLGAFFDTAFRVIACTTFAAVVLACVYHVLKLFGIMFRVYLDFYRHRRVCRAYAKDQAEYYHRRVGQAFVEAFTALHQSARYEEPGRDGPFR
jgi:hypothetical protein